MQRDGVTVFSDSKTFARKAAAQTWHKKKEQLAKPGGLECAIAARAGALRPKLGDAIDRLVAESERELKKTKAQVLRALREDAIADMACEDIRSDHIVDLAKRLLNGGRQTSTVGNYISHLSSVFTVARPAWGYPLDRQAMEDAAVVCKKLGYISKSKERDRRPTEAELDKLMTYFEARSRRRRRSAPMHRIISFASLSTRRDSEICRIL